MKSMQPAPARRQTVSVAKPEVPARPATAVMATSFSDAGQRSQRPSVPSSAEVDTLAGSEARPAAALLPPTSGPPSPSRPESRAGLSPASMASPVHLSRLSLPTSARAAVASAA